MEPSSYKLYNKDDHDSRAYVETYYSEDPNMPFKEDTLRTPMKKLHNAFKMGHITGKLLIDISGGPQVYHLCSACECFQDIILMRLTDRCIMEIMKWKGDRTGAFKWGHTTAHVTDLEGRSDQCEEKEMKMKSAIKRVLKFDIESEDLTDTGVPQADCVITNMLLDKICKNQDDYMRYLRKMIELIKPGGHMILLGATNTTFYTVGGQKFHYFKYDENFARDALVREGMTILQCEDTPRTSESPLSDYGGILFITARKQK